MDKWYSNVSWHNRAWTGVFQLERSLTSQGKWVGVRLNRKIFSFPGRFFWTLRKQKAHLPPGEITMSILLSYMFSSLILVTEAITCKANKLFFFVCWFFLCVCHLYLLRRLNHSLFPTMSGPSPEQTEPLRAAGLCTAPGAVCNGSLCLRVLGCHHCHQEKNLLFCACCVTLNYSLIALPKEVQMSHSLLLLSCHCPCGKRWQHQG